MFNTILIFSTYPWYLYLLYTGVFVLCNLKTYLSQCVQLLLQIGMQLIEMLWF